MPESVKSFVNRWGVLISVFYLALTAILGTLAQQGCDLCGTVSGVAGTLFGMLGISTDPSLGPEIAAVVAGALAAYGGTRKVISIVQKSRAAKP